VGRALWIFGAIQALAHGGYAVVAQVGVNRPVMYAAMALEAGAIGLGTAAFNVLLLRITQRRFSATQYALFSSIFALNRTIAGPPAGLLISAFGWRDFFLLTIPIAIPGLIMLQRFVPITAREVPDMPDDAGDMEHGQVGQPVTLGALVMRGLIAAVISSAFFLLVIAVMNALRGLHGGQGHFDLGLAFTQLFHPVKPGDWLDLIGPEVAGLVVGVAWSAFLAARHGVAGRAR
jgi:PAT family beta-lactamase induction signal transducer AmpG